MFRNAKVALLRLTLLLVAALPTLAHGAGPYLINAQRADYRTQPAYVRDHLAHIETLPFDGTVFSTPCGATLMSGQARSYAAISADFAPLNGITFSRLKHNFALVNVNRPADFFEDWSVTVENFRALARVLKEKGIEGIFFDNEEYRRKLFNYPDDCSDPSRSLQEYRDQARLRGRQIMQAMAGEYPEIVFVALHGPYSSFDGTPSQVRGKQTKYQLEELRGPFSAGLIEGMASRSRFVDGGEVYNYRTADDFEVSYNFRKYLLATAQTDCPFISPYLRPVWPLKVSIAYGVYNHPFGGRDMSPSIMRTTLENALRRCDDYVWLYFESENWNAPGELSQGWTDAIVGARAAANNPPYVPPPSASITTPTIGSLFLQHFAIPITATASDANGSITGVEFFDGSTKLGESLVAPHTFSWREPSVGSHTLTAKVTNSNGATTVSSAVPIIVSASFSASINFQPQGVTPPPGYFADTGDVYGNRGNGLTYGWNSSHAQEMRQRKQGADLRLTTLCQVRPGGRWEIAVPDGAYSVTVGIGDGGYPSTYTVNVAGVNYWQDQYFDAAQFTSQTRVVDVTGGRLTVDQGGGGAGSTRINYLIIAAVAASPAAPSGLTTNPVATPAVDLTWADNSSGEAGFLLERCSSGADFTGAVQVILLPANETNYQDTAVTEGVTYSYRLQSYNDAGSSAFSNLAKVTLLFLDSDGDGVPDALESAPLTVGVDDRQVDSDGDGISNAAEVIAGTDPLDSQSRLQFAGITGTKSSDSGTEVTVSFPTVAGRKYSVEYTDYLTGGIWTLLGATRTGDGTWQFVTDTATSPARFYRLSVSR